MVKSFGYWGIAALAGAGLLAVAGSAAFLGQRAAPPADPNRQLPVTPAAHQARPPKLLFPLRGPALFPFELKTAAPGLEFEFPLDVCQPAHDARQRTFVLEHTGRIVCWEENATHAQVFLDISPRVFRRVESGALGLAFHPQFGQAGAAAERSFFVFYVHEREGVRYNRLSRFEAVAGGETADAESERVLIEQRDDQIFHNGGCLQFGPEGFLYVSLGDEGGEGDEFQNSQQIDRDLFSGILRLDVDCVGQGRSHPIRRQPQTGRTEHYFIPSDNPFVNVPGALEEFWALGMRAPHRFSFDRATGEAWFGDVGESLAEEINRLERGGNYQWCFREGAAATRGKWISEKPFVPPGREIGPVFEYAHREGNGGIIGGYVYRGRNFPELTGKYIYGDCNSGRIWALNLAQPQAPLQPELLALVPGDLQLTSFGQGRGGELFVLAQARRPRLGNRSAVFRLARAEATSSTLPRQLSETGIFQNLESLAPAPGVWPYEINVPFWSDGAEKTRWVALPPANSESAEPPQIKFRKNEFWSFPPGTVFVKHFEISLDEREPARRQRLETRLLVCDERGETYGFTYRWRDDQTEADLLEESQATRLEITAANGTKRTQEWSFPSRHECLVCHNAMAGYVLAVRTEQLHRPAPAGLHMGKMNQLHAWTKLGLLDVKLGPLAQAATVIGSWPRWAPSGSAAHDLTAQARAYLASNCSHCHQDLWRLNLRADANIEHLFDAVVRDELGVPGTKIIKPGRPEQSALYLRLRTCDPAHRMPPLGRCQTDEAGVQLIGEWIRSLGEREPNAERGHRASISRLPAPD